MSGGTVLDRYDAMLARERRMTVAQWVDAKLAECGFSHDAAEWMTLAQLALCLEARRAGR